MLVERKKGNGFPVFISVLTFEKSFFSVWEGEMLPFRRHSLYYLIFIWFLAPFELVGSLYVALYFAIWQELETNIGECLWYCPSKVLHCWWEASSILCLLFQSGFFEMMVPPTAWAPLGRCGSELSLPSPPVPLGHARDDVRRLEFCLKSL